ncbi:hypothetical protein [Haliangium sp.]|uniref:hypothetical protein n=1 Tax=Haliangium sp. TaxID=2663208 RepID=UPI003D0A5205
MKQLLLACALTLGIAPGAALAQSSGTSLATTGDSDCAKAKQAGRACQITFQTGDEIGGTRATAGQDQIVGRSTLSFTNLIRVRESFRHEIIKSAEDL